MHVLGMGVIFEIPGTQKYNKIGNKTPAEKHIRSVILADVDVIVATMILQLVGDTPKRFKTTFECTGRQQHYFEQRRRRTLIRT